MDWAYPGKGIISDKNRPLFDAWDKQDPVDAWECERDRRISMVQGNHNPFIQHGCDRAIPNPYKPNKEYTLKSNGCEFYSLSTRYQTYLKFA